VSQLKKCSANRLTGGTRLGLVPHRDGIVARFCLDFDDHEGDGGNVHLASAVDRFLGAESIKFTSKSGKGLHGLYCCASYNGSYQIGHWGKTSDHSPCGGYADGEGVTCQPYPDFLVWCYLSDENSDGIADTVHLLIMDTGAGRYTIAGTKTFTGECIDLDVTLTSGDLTVWSIDCSKTGATIRIYVP
jgi:hypothetical protein